MAMHIDHISICTPNLYYGGSTGCVSKPDLASTTAVSLQVAACYRIFLLGGLWRYSSKSAA